MKQYLTHKTMRWYGENDVVSLLDIKQAGCEGVVSALHQIPVGEEWNQEEISDRVEECKEAGLVWKVVESLPVSEEIKQRKGDFQEHINNYKTSIRNLAQHGIEVVTYNFMPVLDWLRTNVDYPLANGAKALYFDQIDYILFDLFMLKREGAENDYDETSIAKASHRFENMTRQQKRKLYGTVLLGLPGSDVPFSVQGVKNALKNYENIDRGILKKHLALFLEEVVPVAEEVGVKLAIHPDDPPWPVFGLPRMVSTQEDLQFILDAYPSPSNGLCFCTGSLGARQDNDILQMMDQFQDHIHFFHLRNVKREMNGNFYEADHLAGDTDMVAVVKKALKIMAKREVSIPMRPDHGHKMLDDHNKRTYPGYSAIGRLKGLAELTGLELGLASVMA